MSDPAPIVAVIDDDISVRESIQGLLETAALRVELFASPREYLQEARKDGPNCIILDVRLPGSSGLDFQRELAAAGSHPPIIFITGYADVYMSVQAMKAGAVEFLTKPYRDQALLEAVLAAVQKDRQRRVDDHIVADTRRRFEELTSREREIMALTVSGLQTKQIGGAAGISEVTVRVHRREIMRKMNARSLADLVKMGETLRSHGISLKADAAREDE
ncbi:response regulator transcription factor [Bradyrhizobium sp. INPA01-394B]|uniref:Response regulator transcription factor n=1 Tax=Bradyrhizobium campsiandrae TaxID=1729892 RepID=A0ABR7U495_9BRAD|nr:response regulator [Bradyrhizobium campsiandrae]MBC9879837.1 response regulator transcription factor [Bradyrhizobium campsiandrae]MBC9978830.1 response regulator transcription factor [Bradyrhizobium campsiandrae]